MVAEWVIAWKEKKNFSTRDDVKMFVEVAAPFLGYVLAVGVGRVVGRFVDGEGSHSFNCAAFGTVDLQAF